MEEEEESEVKHIYITSDLSESMFCFAQREI